VVSYLVPLETSVPACITGCVGMPNIPASVAQVVSPLGGASKGIGFSHVPLYGQSNGGVSGYIEGIDPEEYSEFAVLVLQKLNGQWIVAPDCENPLTFIESDLTWHCAISPMAEEVAVYLVDAGFSVDFCVAIPDKGSKDVPEVHGSLASAWVSRVPHISFQSFPPFEQEGNVVIKVTDNDPTLWRVAVYFKVGGEWWTKPLYESPLIQPGIDGLCSVWLDSEGMDFYTMEILVFLVPPNTAVSVCGDCQECQRCSMRPVIPQAVATAWVNRGAGFDTEPPVITLLGDNPLDWPVFVPYVDPEAYAVDVIDGPVPVDIDVSEVNVNVVGQYYVYYSATDSSGNTATATRTVNVVDTEPPVITILGDNPLEWPVGTSYVDPGATATDNYDGNVPVSNVSDVDWSVIGSYTVVYTATDSSGNTATATRTLNVYFDCQAPIIKYTEIPLFGVDDELTGQACRPNDDGAVIVYVRQQDHWWLITDELLDIDSADGSWSCNIDALATEILAFLVPADINPALIPDCDPCTEEPVIGQALASVWVNRSPDFQITYWPPIGATDGYLEGVVWGSVNPSDWKVIVYITVEGRTWIKPDYGIEALTPIGPDGSWSCQIVTGGIDELATHVMAFLVPAGIDLDSVPMCGETFWCGEGPPVIDDAVDLIVIDRTL